MPPREADGVFTAAMNTAYAHAGVSNRVLVPQRDAALGDSPDSGATPAFPVVRVRPWLGLYLRPLFCLQVAWHARSADLVHSRDVLAAFLACAIFRRPTILEIHAMPQSSRGALVSWLLFRTPYRLCVRSRQLLFIVVGTKALAADLQSTYGKRKRILVLPDAVSDAVLAIGGKAVSSQDFSCAYSGSFLQGKGVREIVIPLAAELPDIPFHVYGGEPEQRAALERECQLPNVVFEGYIPHPEVFHRLTEHSVFLLPNQPTMMALRGRDRIGKYTSPMKMFEYMALGRPIIASDVPVLREVLNESCCLFASAGSVAEWRARVQRLAQDRALASRLAKAARARVQPYTWDARTRAILTAVRESRRDL